MQNEFQDAFLVWVSVIDMAVPGSELSEGLFFQVWVTVIDMAVPVHLIRILYVSWEARYWEW
jgi:hypothetical protein